MPTMRCQAIAYRSNEEVGEGTSQVPPAPVGQHGPHDEADTQVSVSAPLSSEQH